MGGEALGSIVGMLALAAGWLAVLPILVPGARRYRPGLVGWPRALLYLGPACAVSIAVLALLRHLLTGQGLAGIGGQVTPFLLRDIDGNLVITLATISATIAFDRLSALSTRSREYSATKRDLTAQRVRTLEAQLHPHFLFNTLHAIIALLHSDTNRARDVVARVKWLLMQVLQTDERVEVTLGEEMQLTRAYLEIQKVRFPEILQTAVSVEPGLADFLVPRMLVQPLVENAVHHGLAGSDRVGVVEVSATALEGNLIISVRDNGRGVRDKQTTEWSEGVGLSNTRLRLHDLYGPTCNLTLTDSAEGCSVDIRLPLSCKSVIAEDARTTPNQPKPVPIEWSTFFSVLLTATIGVAAFWFLLSLVYERVDGQMYSRPLLTAMAVIQASILAIVACLVATIAWIFPISTERKPASIVANALVPFFAVSTHLSLDAVARVWVQLPALHLRPLVVFDFVAAVAVVATVHQYRFRRQERAIAIATLEAERERNDVLHALKRVQMNPSIIGAWLDAVREFSLRSPRDAGVLLVAIGDYLRWAVQAAVNARVPLVDDLAMLKAWERATDLASGRQPASRPTELPSRIAQAMVPSCLLPAIAAEIGGGQSLDLQLRGDLDAVEIVVQLGRGVTFDSAKERLAAFLPADVDIATSMYSSSVITMRVALQA